MINVSKEIKVVTYRTKHKVKDIDALSFCLIIGGVVPIKTGGGHMFYEKDAYKELRANSNPNSSFE